MRIALCCILLAFICQACDQEIKKGMPVNIEAQAHRLLATGDYLAAAREYTRLAGLYPEQAVFYQLRTADSFIRARDIGQASDILHGIKTGNYADSLYKNILQARIAIEDKQAETALKFLPAAPEKGTSAELLASWYRTKSAAYELAINFIGAAGERIQLQEYLLDPVEQLKNIKHIWQDLNHVKLPLLRELRHAGFTSMTAWIELTIINKTMLFKPGLLEPAIKSWSEQYPHHTAIPAITREILAQSQKAVLQPVHIAILLPFSGQYEKASDAIRDGFLAAWYGEPGPRPRISLYDAAAVNIENVYRRAVKNGADFIVGPLEKQAVDALLRAGKINVTTLALNRTDQTSLELNQYDSRQMPELFQFGLSPENEARQVAARARVDGHERALVITPDNDWGSRLSAAFSKTWTALGGKVLEYVSYNPRSRDYSTPVKKLLNIDSSLLRANKLRHKLNRDVKSEARVRADADMIFMAAVPLSARQIVPQFSFYLASDLPVYSTSQTYSGIKNAQLNSDLNGVMFTDMPALLQADRQSSSIHRTLNRNWSAETSSYRRLYALGIDAYRLIPYLGKLALQDTAVYHGETGDLSVGGNGRIQSQLLWAKFVNGLPRLID